MPESDARSVGLKDHEMPSFYRIVAMSYFQDARDDVGGAQRCGMKGILVKTGEL